MGIGAGYSSNSVPTTKIPSTLVPLVENAVNLLTQKMFNPPTQYNQPRVAPLSEMTLLGLGNLIGNQLSGKNVAAPTTSTSAFGGAPLSNVVQSMPAPAPAPKPSA